MSTNMVRRTENIEIRFVRTSKDHFEMALYRTVLKGVP
jgi:hypothetical protein